MADDTPEVSPSPPADAPYERKFTLRAVTAITGAVVGLTFLFGFGNVWTLALDLGVPPWVAPLVAPAVDLSVLGLLLAIRYLALNGASRDQLRPARRLLVFSSLMTLALNVAAPLITRQWGKAAFDAVGPLLLIGWAEVAPGLLQALGGTLDQGPGSPALTARDPGPDGDGAEAGSLVLAPNRLAAAGPELGPNDATAPLCDDDLLERARQENARHWAAHNRPISAETLRKRLHVGAARSRMLAAVVRADAERATVEPGAGNSGRWTRDDAAAPQAQEGRATGRGRRTSADARRDPRAAFGPSTVSPT